MGKLRPGRAGVGNMPGRTLESEAEMEGLSHQAPGTTHLGMQDVLMTPTKSTKPRALHLHACGVSQCARQGEGAGPCRSDKL